MAWTSPGTVSTGDVLTASKWNADVVDNMAAIGDARTSYTPTLTNVAVGTGGNAETTGKYVKAGRLVVFRVKLVLGTSGASVSGKIGISLPFTAAGSAAGYNETASFNGTFLDLGTAIYPAMAVQETNTRIDLFAINAAGTFAVAGAATSSTVPFTWAAGDQIHLSGVYEAAS
jgi:hypothetical protein